MNIVAFHSVVGVSCRGVSNKRACSYLVRWGSGQPWWSPCCPPAAGPGASCSGTRYEWSSAEGHRPPGGEGGGKTVNKLNLNYYIQGLNKYWGKSDAQQTCAWAKPSNSHEKYKISIGAQVLNDRS